MTAQTKSFSTSHNTGLYIGTHYLNVSSLDDTHDGVVGMG